MAYDFSRKLTQPDDRWKDWAQVGSLWALTLVCLSANTINFEHGKFWRIFSAGMGTASALLAGAKTRQIQDLENFRVPRDIMRRDLFVEVQAQQLPSVSGKAIAPEPQVLSDQTEFYDWDNLADENTGIMIAGNAGSGKTSVASWCLGKLTERQPAIIEVLDPHGGINKIWSDLGLSVLCEYEEIEARLNAAITELDERRARSKRGEPVGQPYIFVCDELDSCLDNFEDPKTVSKAIKRLGKEGRKYDLSLLFISHTSNVGAKGIDAQERNCYVNIYLGGTAHAMCDRQYKFDSPQKQAIASAAYPCMVSSGGLPPQPAAHPTHGQYQQFKKKGNPPQGLLPIRTAAPESQVISLEKAWELPPASSPADTVTDCPYCGCDRTHKHGGNRRKCLDCGKTWTISE